ncbi:MFS transporter, partial [Listeria monocytogenes]|nr:MFS transporter [Listeria monocytogenes]
MEQTKVKAVTIAVFVATFMAAIEGTIVSTAMPTIVSQLDGIELMNWIFSVYLLTSAVTVPIYGKLSDLYGRKNIFVIATIIFIIGSSLCGFAQNMEQLIIFRAIQGIGAGGILPSTMTIIADVYPFEKRAKVLG